MLFIIASCCFLVKYKIKFFLIFLFAFSVLLLRFIWSFSTFSNSHYPKPLSKYSITYLALLVNIFYVFFSFVVILFSCLLSTSFLLYTISPTLSITFNKKIIFFYILYYTIILLLLFTIILYNYYLIYYAIVLFALFRSCCYSCYSIYIYIIYILYNYIIYVL